MRFAALGFALGVCLLQQQAALPGAMWLAVCFAFAAIAGVGLSRRASPVIGAGAMFIGFAALGFAWAAALAHLRLSDRLDAALEGRDVVVSGVVGGLPQAFERGVRFDFDVEYPETGVPRRIVLSSYGGFAQGDSQSVLPVRAGERWRFAVRLRRPHGGANPHGFDYEAWLLERGIRATGYVRMPSRRGADERAVPERLAALVPRPRYWIEGLREAAREKIRGALPERPYAGILIALAIGDQNAIDPKQWQLFARTGVSHLMSISGLHVTMVAGLLAMFVSWCWRRSETLALALPAQKAAALAGFLAAFAYCLVSGFAVPAQRTLYMVGVVAAALWLGRATSASRVLAAALLIVLALDPWAVLSPGFWLSFAAVAVIFYVATGRSVQPHWLAQWGRVQWAVTVGLAPLLLVLLLFAASPAGPRAGELWITVLDVGQGLSVLARTERHALLYDAGPAFNAAADSGSRVIVPYLRGEGIAALDALVVSHDDRDHSGGAASVLEAIPVGVLWSSLSPDHALLEAAAWRAPCRADRKWFWDGVAFEFLHPQEDIPAGRAARANNRSCVLRIEAPGGRVLLTGDIERAAEHELLRRAPGLLRAEVLLVPHHGSATSSAPEFVRQVAPRYAVFTVGYRNRFGHPREDVLQRYREAGSELLRTDAAGAIRLRLEPGNLQVDAERDRARRYWHES